MSTSLHTEFAALTHLAEGQVMFNRQHGESVTLLTGTRIPVWSRRDGQFLKPVLDINKKKNTSRSCILTCGVWRCRCRSKS